MGKYLLQLQATGSRRVGVHGRSCIRSGLFFVRSTVGGRGSCRCTWNRNTTVMYVCVCGWCAWAVHAGSKGIQEKEMRARRSNVLFASSAAHTAEICQWSCRRMLMLISKFSLSYYFPTITHCLPSLPCLFTLCMAEMIGYRSLNKCRTSAWERVINGY